MIKLSTRHVCKENKGSVQTLEEFLKYIVIEVLGYCEIRGEKPANYISLTESFVLSFEFLNASLKEISEIVKKRDGHIFIPELIFQSLIDILSQLLPIQNLEKWDSKFTEGKNWQKLNYDFLVFKWSIVNILTSLA